MSIFSEKTRVQVPAILHLTRLGYKYIPKSDLKLDANTNIFLDKLVDSMNKINPTAKIDEIKEAINDLVLSLSNDDLGRKFFSLLIKQEGIRFIDFSNIDNNDFSCGYEVPFIKGEEEFRPDVTIFINGLPLSFIEVKVPNNHDGILAERNRMKDRFANPAFKKFFNELQLLIFSNNMQYDDKSFEHIQGAFYCTGNTGSCRFSPFREQDTKLHEDSIKLMFSDENIILKDTNSIAIKGTPEYKTNLNPLSPTNKIITSLLNKERFLWILKYGICYAEVMDNKTGIVNIEKHIMRYPQLFASLTIQNKLNEGVKKGIIWHTQGSGKTELAFYQVKLLTDYYYKKCIVPLFFFVVDRIDLFKQACKEFRNRGLTVETVNSKDEFAKAIKKVSNNNKATEYKITVVNIQKFSEDSHVIKKVEDDLHIQRIFFLDEVHRSYNPTGSFLSNLFDADRESIKIGLTGTPLILSDCKSTSLFGDYIHKYYYNESINDGYTLRLIREPILKAFAGQMKEIKDQLVKQGTVDSIAITSHKKYVKGLLDYIINDFDNFVIANDNYSIPSNVGCMIVCDSNPQAREVQKQLKEAGKKSLLILHNEDTKEIRDQEIDKYKYSDDYEYLVVDRMLLTGFDCPRVKKMYLLKMIKAHSLLQCLTRVNRPYLNFKYGYVCDFADIMDEFKKTNDAYMKELNDLYGSEFEKTCDIFLSNDEIVKRLDTIKNKMFSFEDENMEVFSQQISEINDIKEINEIKRCLEDARDLFNVVKFNDNLDIYSLDIKKVTLMLREVERRHDAIKLKEALETDGVSQSLINLALENVVFAFIKGKSHELILADKLRESLSKARHEIMRNVDPKDKDYVALCDELKRILTSKGIEEATQETIDALEKLYQKAKAKNDEDERISAKYNGDAKYCRLHKRIKEFAKISDITVCDILKQIKEYADNMIENNEHILENETYVEDSLFNVVYDLFEKHGHKQSMKEVDTINSWIFKEYFSEYRGAQL